MSLQRFILTIYFSFFQVLLKKTNILLFSKKKTKELQTTFCCLLCRDNERVICVQIWIFFSGFLCLDNYFVFSVKKFGLQLKRQWARYACEIVSLANSIFNFQLRKEFPIRNLLREKTFFSQTNKRNVPIEIWSGF